jgi:hypothetical protein
MDDVAFQPAAQTKTAKPKTPNLLGAALRVGVHTVWDNLSRPVAKSSEDVPYTIEAVSKEWLSDVLCGDSVSAEVATFDFGGRTSGSTVRRRINLAYSGDRGNADLPATVFAKSSPTFFNRLALSVSRTIENEALFYRHIRPLLNLEAPRGYFSSYDLKSGRSIHLLEDLVATKEAIFCSPRNYIGREKAEDLVSILAALHGRFYGQKDLARQFPWLMTYPEWFASGYETFGLRTFHDKAMVEAVEVIPEDITRRRAEIWPAQLKSLKAHTSEPQTLIHGDVHLGNWYITGAGRMGLCDWQCVSIGSWARDFAYAVGATLTIEDRRAWEKDLLRIYLQKMEAASGVSISFEDAWLLYRQQMPAALLMWTVTLCHSPLMPDMQPREVAMEMVRRLTQAMSDIGSLDSFNN